jgi:DNA repair protein SbcC/Rad50
MIPVRLRMHNFMPYKGDAPELCFAPIHTACISGDNGAGKSSIIDAITWALWGESRAGGKNQDALVHQGEREAAVEFDFQAGGQLYRVIRRHALPKGKGSGKSSLDLFSCLDGVLMPICGDNKTQTQAKIDKDILHMDYDTFVNSAYIRQGHADEFTRQDPAKRKEVLASILGLSIYDTFEEQAKEKAKAAEQEKLKHSAAIEELESDLAQRSASEQQLSEAEFEAGPAEKATVASENTLKQARAEAQKLEAVQAQAAQLESAIRRHNEDLARENERLMFSRNRVATYQKLLDDRAGIESGFESLKNARRLADELNAQARRLARLNEQKSQYERKIDQAQAELTRQQALLSTGARKLEEQAASGSSLKIEQQKMAPIRRTLEKLDAEVASRREAVQHKKSEYSRVAAAITGLKCEIASIDDKLKLLSGHEHAARCPVCETELGEEKLEIVRGRYAEEKSQKRQQIKQGEVDTSRLAAEIRADDAEIARLEQRLKKEMSELVSRGSLIDKGLKEASDAASSLVTERARLSEVEEKLARRDYAHPEQEALAQIAGEAAAIPYDEKTLESTLQMADVLQGFEERKKMLDEADRLSAQEKDNLSQALKTITEIKARLSADSMSRQALDDQLKAASGLSAKLEQAEADFNQKSETLKALRERLAVLKARLAEFKNKESRVSERRKAYDTAAENESLYRELARIFGKNGIQAMLIETALPEIEEEANRLLARMTDGRMNLTIEPQKATKKGDLVETLDIKIADELGTRSYEMFSGGEAFRIDFSVRIALSRLLARRAGAPLPTLIIDEGFGTQDADGIEKLKEAINSVQDDFQKILVITHIDELKDAFPTRIDVVKTAEGSTIQVS